MIEVRMNNPLKLTISLEDGFQFNEVKADGNSKVALPLPAPLGDLVGFTNLISPDQGVKFAGNGFNTIFRPQNAASPTPLPNPVPASDNVLELNLTSETLTFSGPLGNVPNRGFAQKDISLNAVPYVQSIADITLPGTSPGIHFEPGMWVAVPATANPIVNQMTYTRMASIPHGVTITAQGTSSGRINGSPLPHIAPVNINPFFIGGPQNPPSQPFFASQTATQQNTARIPQDLTAYISAGTITQAMLDDPNTLLRSHLAGQNVESFVALIITTDATGAQPTPPPPPGAPNPTPPGFGGGTDEIAFLLGDNNTPPRNPNANAFKMTAIFWVETILEKIVVPPCRPGQPPIMIEGTKRRGLPTPVFSVKPPIEIAADKVVLVPFTQIQYTQTVFLNFGPLTWPHVSVATLVPADAIEVPNNVWG
jgi:hypothetical protein